MHEPLLISVAVAAFLGSPHCAAMCGGLVSFCHAGALPGERARVHLVYNGARGVVYATLGAIAGAFGNAVDTLGVHAGLRDAALLLAGTVMLLLVAREVLSRRGISLVRRTPWASVIGAKLGAVTGNLRARSPVQRGLTMGATTALLPCGWLYLWVVAASATARPLTGALVMVAFWLGTLPMMVGLGWLSQRFSVSLQRRAPVLTALAFLGFGLWSLFGRWDVPDSITNLAQVQQSVARPAQGAH